MRTKECCLCHKQREVSDFNRKSSTKDGLQRKCRECSRAASKRHYADNKSYYMAKGRFHAHKVRKSVYDYLISHPCVDCGESDPVVLDLDHVRGEKVQSVSRMASSGRSSKAIEEEFVS